MSTATIAATLLSITSALTGLSNSINTLSNVTPISQTALVRSSTSVGVPIAIPNSVIEITTATSLLNATVGNLYSATISATGGEGSYNWSVSAGVLPPGLSLVQAYCKAMDPCQPPLEISGVPTKNGTYNFTIKVISGPTSSGNTYTTEKQFTIIVDPIVSLPSIVTTSPLLSGVVGTSYSSSISATGGNESYAWSIGSGALPPGISLASGVCFTTPCQLPASLSGTPTTPGVYTFNAQLTSGLNKINMVEKQFSITVNPATTTTVWYDPTFISASADSVGVTIYASYKNCPSSSVIADVWLVNQPDGVNKFQDRVYLSSTVNGNPIGYAYFKQPVPAGTYGGNILINLWSIKSDCTTYASNAGATAPSPKTFFLSQPVQISQFYDALNQNRLIKLDTPTLTVKLDRNTGATYEVYNKRAISGSSQDLAPSNAIHSNMGAVLQVAFHDQIDAALKKTQGIVGCGGQGYWNPTQAGAYCSFNNGVANQTPVVPMGSNTPQVSCDGVNNQSCSNATKSISFGDFSMLNWDYYSGYTGPLNPLDLLQLSENVTANDSFIEYDLKVTNQGVDRRGFLEMPTFYFTNNYRRYYFQDPNLPAGSPITQVDIPLQKQIGSSYSSATHDEINWISFENTSAIKNDVYTIAWFYDNNYKNAIVPYPGGNGTKFNGYAVQTQGVSGAIKFVNYPVVVLKTSQLYNLKYVIFPYRYDEMITSRFGTKSVKDTIIDIRAEFDAKNNSNPINIGTTSPTSGNIIGQPNSSSTITMSMGKKVKVVVSKLNVRQKASLSSLIIGTEKNGALGTISEGPIADSTGLIWWKIKFDNGVYGWAANVIPPNYILALALASGGTPEPAYIVTSDMTTTNTSLSKNLYIGVSDNEVLVLQNFLISRGFLASNLSTGYMGSLTKAAVMKYQCEKNIVCDGDEPTTGYGMVGSKTRKAINLEMK